MSIWMEISGSMVIVIDAVLPKEVATQHPQNAKEGDFQIKAMVAHTTIHPETRHTSLQGYFKYTHLGPWMGGHYTIGNMRVAAFLAVKTAGAQRQWQFSPSSKNLLTARPNSPTKCELQAAPTRSTT